jgi:hypothetical protein
MGRPPLRGGQMGSTGDDARGERARGLQGRAEVPNPNCTNWAGGGIQTGGRRPTNSLEGTDFSNR